MSNRSHVPTIAVVVPCRNDAELLGRCLEGFKAQARLADALIVVDNASTDNSEEVARAHGADVVYEPRAGITWAGAAGYNRALELGADIIVRTDADAVVSPHYLQQIEAFWHCASEDTVALTGAAVFDGFPRLTARLYLGAYRLSVGSALGHPPLFGTNCSFRASWWGSIRDSLNLADTQVHDDIQLSFAVRPDETVRFVPWLEVAMDGRALKGSAQRRRRFDRGWYSMMRGFEKDPPQKRLPRRRIRRLRYGNG